MPVSPHRCRAAARSSAGFTLLEVLVAVVVLSIGLLGVGKMVLYAARAGGSSAMRTEATQQAYAILDYMHANRPGALTQAYDIAIGAVPVVAQDCFNAGPCTTPAAIANYDLAAWKTQLTAVLPLGDGSVTTVPAAAVGQTMVTIVVRWDDQAAQRTFQGTSPTTPMTVTLQSQL